MARFCAGSGAGVDDGGSREAAVCERLGGGTHTWDGRSVAIRLDTALDNLIRSELGLDPDTVAPATYLDFSEGAKPADTSTV